MPTTTTAIEHLRAAHLGNKFPAYTSVGSYTIIYLTQDGADLCACCVNGDNGSEVGNSEYDGDPQWTVVAGDIYWEGPPRECDHCGEMIESSYGDPDPVD